jgi:hypothetical protein
MNILRISDIKNEWNKGCHPGTNLVKGGSANWLDSFCKTRLDINVTLLFINSLWCNHVYTQLHTVEVLVPLSEFCWCLTCLQIQKCCDVLVKYLQDSFRQVVEHHSLRYICWLIPF